jgi:hypothetical protein
VLALGRIHMGDDLSRAALAPLLIRSQETDIRIGGLRECHVRSEHFSVRVKDNVRPAATVQDDRVFVKASDGIARIPIWTSYVQTAVHAIDTSPPANSAIGRFVSDGPH